MEIFTMLTVREGIYQGWVSPTLLKLHPAWNERGEDVGVVGGFILAAVFAALAWWGFSSLDGFIGALISGFVALAAFACLVGTIDSIGTQQKILKDCKRLADIIVSGPGYLNETELKATAIELLELRVHEVYELESAGKHETPSHEAARLKVKETFDIAFTFGLLGSKLIGDFYRQHKKKNAS